jgi:hypothetical protein
MIVVMVKEADLNRVKVPEDYEVLDAMALGSRLGFKRDTVLAYLSRRNFRRILRPNRQLAMGRFGTRRASKSGKRSRRIRRVRSRSGKGKGYSRSQEMPS